MCPVRALLAPGLYHRHLYFVKERLEGLGGAGAALSDSQKGGTRG